MKETTLTALGEGPFLRLPHPRIQATHAAHWQLARAQGGRFPEAMAWAKEISAYLGDKHGASVEVHVESFGETNTIHWFVDYEDLASVERMNAALAADMKYWGMIKGANEAQLFIEGSIQDQLTIAV